eukprot:gnl/TRDRNA2_/TRDRNA2_83471_c0_seq1.p1 gnl/TRDRNA2_/TRDRNA2_83471_c0~~gnl/TRDRNA2_/TRDRNA2_83471_c0_seq1.p1  ORF type:complete len:294 (+),score=15.96 gnl/TRDRNA2_/TRDRNA2_83471_c0_seq1:70-951(+)
MAPPRSNMASANFSRAYHQNTSSATYRSKEDQWFDMQQPGYDGGRMSSLSSMVRPVAVGQDGGFLGGMAGLDFDMDGRPLHAKSMAGVEGQHTGNSPYVGSFAHVENWLSAPPVPPPFAQPGPGFGSWFPSPGPDLGFGPGAFGFGSDPSLGPDPGLGPGTGFGSDPMAGPVRDLGQGTRPMAGPGFGTGPFGTAPGQGPGPDYSRKASVPAQDIWSGQISPRNTSNTFSSRGQVTPRNTTNAFSSPTARFQGAHMDGKGWEFIGSDFGRGRDQQERGGFASLFKGRGRAACC